MIEVRLFATFREGREKIYKIDTSNFKIVLDVLNHFKINKEEVAICLVNGMHSSVEDSIKSGDVLALFPPVGGG